MQRRDFLSTGAAGLAALPLAAQAQSRPKDVLVVATEFGPNSLDIHTVGANRASYGVSWLCYDRLMTYGKKTLPDGRVVYDIDKLETRTGRELEDRARRQLGDLQAAQEREVITTARR